MSDYFLRQIQLWGEDAQNNLQNKKIAIIGCGGLGSSLSMALGTSGIGTIYLVDFDTVTLHNIHRQIAFKVEDVNKPKAELIAKLLEQKCPFVKAIPKVMYFDEFTKENIKVDLIIDAMDNLPTRKAIGEYAKKCNTPWIYGSVEEFHGQVCFFDKANFDAFKITDRKPGGIAAPIIMQVASLQANLAIRYLIGLEVKKDLLYYLNYKNGEFDIQKYNMPTN